MTICFVSHSAGSGGAERVLLETIEVLQARGVECRALLPGRGQLCTELDRLGVTFSVISFPMWMSRGEVRPLTWLKAALGTLVNSVLLAWKIRSWKCDLVYSNTITVCVGALAARLLGLPHVWHLHEFGMEDQGLSFLFGARVSLSMVNRLSWQCICVSKALGKKYELWIKPNKLVVIYPSMHHALRGAKETDSFDVDAPKTKRFRCVIAGALMEGKGQEDSILAFAHLKEAGVDAELIIVGDGILAYRRRLEGLVSSNGLESHVSFIGRVKNVFPIMQRSNAILVCSRSEAFGRVTVEGMLAGKPVIAARGGATTELIKDGVNGLLYEPGDPVDLAGRIEYLYHNPEVAEQLGNNAHQWVEKCFTVERYSNELLGALPLSNLRRSAISLA